MNATGSRERANDGKLKRLVADLTPDKSMVCKWIANGPRDIGARMRCESEAITRRRSEGGAER